MAILTCLFILGCYISYPQVAINSDGTQPNSSTGPDVKFTDKGFLPPRLTTAQRNAIVSPAEGLVIYNTEEKTMNIFNGTSWAPLVLIVCGLPFVDSRNEMVYSTVQIGTQC
jgi:hypothetical protein